MILKTTGRSITKAKFTQKDYDNAMRCYDEALEIDPKLAGAHNAKAVALSKKKENKLAIELDPTFFDLFQISFPPNNADTIGSRDNITAPGP